MKQMFANVNCMGSTTITPRMLKRRNKVTITKLESDIMKWTLEQLDSLETEILKLHLHTKLSDSTLADCMGKIDTERYKLNQANGVSTGDELVLPIQSVVCSALPEDEENKPYCTDCGNEDLEYIDQYANGDFWRCKECKKEFIH